MLNVAHALENEWHCVQLVMLVTLRVWHISSKEMTTLAKKISRNFKNKV